MDLLWLLFLLLLLLETEDSLFRTIFFSFFRVRYAAAAVVVVEQLAEICL